MSTTDFMQAANRQTHFVARLIAEAETSADPARAEMLYGMAREEADNMAESLRRHLSRKTPPHHLAERAVA